MPTGDWATTKQHRLAINQLLQTRAVSNTEPPRWDFFSDVPLFSFPQNSVVPIYLCLCLRLCSPSCPLVFLPALFVTPVARIANERSGLPRQ